MPVWASQAVPIVRKLTTYARYADPKDIDQALQQSVKEM